MIGRSCGGQSWTGSVVSPESNERDLILDKRATHAVAATHAVVATHVAVATYVAVATHATDATDATNATNAMSGNESLGPRPVEF